MEQNGYFKSKIFHGEKWLVQEQNSPWKKTATSRPKFSMKNSYFKSQILHGEKWLLQEQNSPWRKMATSRIKFSMEKR